MMTGLADSRRSNPRAVSTSEQVGLAVRRREHLIDAISKPVKTGRRFHEDTRGAAERHEGQFVPLGQPANERFQPTPEVTGRMGEAGARIDQHGDLHRGACRPHVQYLPLGPVLFDDEVRRGQSGHRSASGIEHTDEH